MTPERAEVVAEQAEDQVADPIALYIKIAEDWEARWDFTPGEREYSDEFYAKRDEVDARWRKLQEQAEYLDGIDDWHPSMGYSLDDPKRYGPGGEW